MRYIIKASSVLVYDELWRLLAVYGYEPTLVNDRRLFVVVVDPSDEMFVRMEEIGCTIALDTKYRSEKPDEM